MNDDGDKSILFVGLVCIDIVTVMKNYPIEDIGQRCEDCLWQRGGNAGNSATVFSLLGGKASFFGTLSDSMHSDFLIKDLDKNQVSHQLCFKVSSSSCPISIVILNQSNGTRTILHTNKNLRELTFQDFKSRIVPVLPEICWIHFEGRDNAEEISKMLLHIKELNEQLKAASSTCRVNTSLEAEKLRLLTGINKYEMWNLPDVLFVSKDFAMNEGYEDMQTAVQGYSKKVKAGAIVICAWGEKGAAAMSESSGLVVSQAFPPDEILDTCGAGDTFNAAVIRALSQGKDLQESIEFGCFIAGKKCGFQGFDELKIRIIKHL